MPTITTQELFKEKRTISTGELFRTSDRTITTEELIRPSIIPYQITTALEEEEQAMVNILSIPLYPISPPLREYIQKRRLGKRPLIFGDVPEEFIPRTTEELAKIAFPAPVPPTGGALARQFTGRLATEFVGLHKPSTLLLFKGAAKAIKPLARPVGRFISRVTPPGVKRVLTKQLTIGRGRPIGYQELAKQAKLKRLAGGREAEEVGRILTRTPAGRLLTPGEQRYVGRIFRQETIESPRLLAKPLYGELKQVAIEGRAIMDKWSQALIDSGIPKKHAMEVIEGNIGKYMARMYPKHLERRPVAFGLAKKLRLRLSGLKHRKDLSETTLKAMRVVKEPALPTAIRVNQISTSIANNKLFSSVAQNPEWSSATNVTGKMIKMPNTPALGALRNKFVIPSIAEDINQMSTVPTRAIQAYNQALSIWKRMKVVWNPSTHSRNTMSNAILLDLSGVNHIRQAQLFPRVAGDYLRKGPLYRQALEDGAIGGEFVGGEVTKLRSTYLTGTGSHFNRIMNWLKIPFKKAENLYQAEEQLAKMIKYTDVISKGGSRQIAAKEAQKWLFNYTEIPRIMEFAKQASPFITFTYKAIPRVAETLVENPLKVYKYYAFANAWNSAASQTLGMSKEEYEDMQKNLPDWMLKDIANMPTNLLMPWRDKHGREQLLNLEYILPIGMAPEILERGLLRGGFTNPFFQVLADLQKNKDFRGKDIVPVESTPAEAAKLTIEYVYRQMAPSLAPALPFVRGGYSFEKLMDAIKGRPDFADRVREVPQVILDTLAGLKITPIDRKESKKFKQIEKKNKVKDLQIQLMRIMRNRVISDIEKEIQRKNILEKIRRVIKK